MNGHFQAGAFVESSPQQTPIMQSNEEPNIGVLGQAMLIGAGKYFDRYQQVKSCGVVWLRANNGFMVMCTNSEKYGKMMERFCERLK